MFIKNFLSLLIIALLLTFTGNLFSQKTIPPDPSIKIGKLSNGMTYYIKYNSRPEKRAELRLAVKVGSVVEDDDQKGLAHFCEHMAFNGTKSFPRQELVNYVESIGMGFGADLNAYTSFDQTVYMLKVPTDDHEKLMKGLKIIEEWATSVSYDDSEIDKERGVVLEEERMYRSAESRVERKHMPVSYYKSKYAERDVIGDTNIIAKAPYSVSRRFYSDWYRPDLMAVCVVGDIDVNEIEKILKENFSNYSNPPNERKREEYAMPYHDHLLVSVETDKELSFPTIEFSILQDRIDRILIENSKELAIRSLANSIIYKRLSEYTSKPNPPFQFASVNYSRYLGDKDSFSGFVYAKGDNVNYSLEILLKEIFRAKQMGFTESELERVKSENLRWMEKAVTEKDKTESNRIASQMVSNFLYSYPIPSPEYSFDNAKELYPQITLKDINLAIKNMVKDNSVKIIISAPDRADVKLPTKENITALYNKMKNEKYESYVDFIPDKPLFDKEVIPGKIVNSKVNSLMDFKELELSNGAKVILKSTDFKNDEIVFSANSYGGASLVSDDVFYSAENAASIVSSSGMGPYDYNQLKKYMSGKIAYISSDISDQTESMRGQASPKDLELLFQMLNLRFTEPKKDKEAFEAYIENMIQSYKDFQNDPDAAYYDTMTAVMSNYHPRYGYQTMEKINKINLDDAIKVYKERFSDASDFTFYFIGSFKYEEIEPLVEKYIASMPGKGIKETWKDDGLTRPKEKFVKNVYSGTEFKSSISYQYYGDYEYNYKNNILLSALREVMNIRLREVIREDKGGTYGAYMRLSPIRIPKEQYRVSIGWGCSPDRVDELSEALESLIKEAQGKPLDNSYIQKFQESSKRELETNMKQNYWWSYQIQSLMENRMTEEDFANYLDYVNAITVNDIQEAAKKYLVLDKFGKFVHYPESKK
ncbi:MAG: insulinase family protein [bacterium]